MTSDQGARSFLADATLILAEARASLAAGHHHRVIDHEDAREAIRKAEWVLEAARRVVPAV